MNKIDQLFLEWQSIQPLKEEYQQRLDQKFMLEFNYNSNHIEGNTLTYGQTEMLLMFGRSVDNANMRDLEEMKASNVGLKMVKELAKDTERPLSENFIKTLHQTLLREDYSVYRQQPDGSMKICTIHAGQYKTVPNTVLTSTGKYFHYASPEETPALMGDLLQWYNQMELTGVLSPIELAALFHYRYIRIHPFDDGNGRISRLIVNYILAKHGYPMIVIKSADKANYLTALNKSDLNISKTPSIGARAEIGQVRPFVEYLSKCLEEALSIAIKAAHGESIEDDDDFEKQLKIIERNARKKIPEYAHIATPQDKVDVFNNFHRILGDRLISALEPVRTFYNTMTVHYYMTKDRDAINGNNWFSLDGHSPISPNLTEAQLNVLNEAQCIMLHMYFKGINARYKMKDNPINIRANVYFDLTTYSFDGHSYPYGTYPTNSQINDYINKVKDTVLQKIQTSIEEP
ncbi:MAG: Fic family protein [Bacteroidales bacterium]|nr:Fic family protein [Bacteroidales bacterium]